MLTDTETQRLRAHTLDRLTACELKQRKNEKKKIDKRTPKETINRAPNVRHALGRESTFQLCFFSFSSFVRLVLLVSRVPVREWYRKRSFYLLICAGKQKTKRNTIQLVRPMRNCGDAKDATKPKSPRL